jgi:hypothetical protein
MPIVTPRGKASSMDARRFRNRNWLVVLMALMAMAGTAVMLGADVADLDPRVWQAIVAGADFETPELLQPSSGDTP